MTPEAWALIIAAIFGSNGLTQLFSYVIRQRSDTRKETELARLKIALERAQAAREKSKSDEAQTDKIAALPTDIIYLLGKTLDRMAEQDKQLARIEKQDEANYRTTESNMQRWQHETNSLIETLEDRINGRFTEQASAFIAALKEAVSDSQRQYAARDALSNFKIGLKFPPETDCRWKRCIVSFQRASVQVWTYPLLMGEVTGRLVSGDTVRVITEAFPGWAAVQSVDVWEVQGYVESRYVEFAECGDTKTLPKVNPN